MKNTLIEASYPISFREKDSETLGNLLKNRRSVTLIGMTRVGISSFLRFFLNKNGISKTYIKEESLFIISVDLNDLVEREIFPFWILTLKRIADGVEASNLSKTIKKQISLYFLDSIQTQDLFITIDYVRRSINLLIENGLMPTIFFLRFDRIISAVTPEFYNNLEGLIEASNRKLSFVFTSARSLDVLAPKIFTKHSLSSFCDNYYIKPTKNEDTRTILDINKNRRGIKLAKNLEDELIRLVGGYTQYLHYSLINIGENKNRIKSVRDLTDLLLSDERILLQSEEIWESLMSTEKEILIKITDKKKLSANENKDAEYLIKTGFFDEEKLEIFSPLFEYFVKLKENERKREKALIELTKKEYVLLKLLENNINEICEREHIIETVWPEAENFGVSDWAVDRLVARLRGKLKYQNEKYEIITIKTRGYKLIK